MDNILGVVQALEQARAEVQLLVESAARSRVHKQRCHDVAHAGQHVFRQIESAARQRTLGDPQVLAAVVRLRTATTRARERVDELGNPGAFGWLKRTSRKVAERVLSDQGRAIMDVLSQQPALPLSIPENCVSIYPYPSTPSAVGQRNREDWTQPNSLVPSTPLYPIPSDSMSIISSPAGRQAVPFETRTSNDSLASPTGKTGDSDLPFGQRIVRSSDNNPVQRLTFMRGAGTGTGVQLMVTLPKQNEVYSAALDSFHSDTPLEWDGQQITSTALYEPTIDLITGHMNGTVLVYGREELGSSDGSARAAAIAQAVNQEGMPLVIRLSRTAVTALHCIPAVELDAVSEPAVAAAANVNPADGARSSSDGTTPSSPAPPSGASPPPPSTPAGATPTSAASPTPGGTGSCTVDDVLLFTGDAGGRVMAVRYSRVQPEVLATTVFQGRRLPSGRLGSSTTSNPESLSPEITGMLFRSGYLIVCTASDYMYSIRVMRTTPPAAASAGAVAETSGGGAGADGGGASPPTASNPTSTEHRNPKTAPAGTGNSVTFASTLPASTSVNLLTPAVSTMPQGAASGSVSVSMAAAKTTGGSGSRASNGVGSPGRVDSGGNGSGGGASGASNGGNGIRRGPLHLAVSVVDSFSFPDFGGCTALVALDWGKPDAADETSASPSTVGAGTTVPVDFFPEIGTSRVAAGADAAGSSPQEPVTSRVITPRSGPWRLLTAHAIGQLVMWDVSTGRLQLICAIGSPGPQIVQICLFPSLAMMVELLGSGDIRVGPLPSSSLAPPVNPMGGVPVWRLGHTRIRAHHSRITAAASLQNCIATGSRAGGVKVWNAAELRDRAAKQGVSFLPVVPAAKGVPGGSVTAADGTGGSIAAGSSRRKPLDFHAETTTPTSHCPSNGGDPFGGGGDNRSRYPMHSGISTPPRVPALTQIGSMERSCSVQPMFPPMFGNPQLVSRMPSGRAPYAPVPMGHVHSQMPSSSEMPYAQASACAPSPPQSVGGANQPVMLVPGPRGGGGAVAAAAAAGVMHSTLDSPAGSVNLRPKEQGGSVAGRPTSDEDGTERLSESSSVPPANSGAKAPRIPTQNGQAPAQGSKEQNPQNGWTIEKALTQAINGGTGEPEGNSHDVLPPILPAGDPPMSSANGGPRDRYVEPSSTTAESWATSQGGAPPSPRPRSPVPWGLQRIPGPSNNDTWKQQSGGNLGTSGSGGSMTVFPVVPPPKPSNPRDKPFSPMLQATFITTNDLRLIDPIGQGAEGTVWRGRWHHIDVAVKEMHPATESFGKLASIAKEVQSCPDSGYNSQEVAGLVREVSALIDLSQHPNIIRFVGVCIAPPRIVTEYYRMGSLFTMLKEARQGNIRIREKLTWTQWLLMLQDIAAGMAYLHSRNYIHGDLRSPNVFVTDNQRLKIGDFGFARILGTAQDPKGDVPARLTNPRWQAPEVYGMDNPTATTAADVYSFAIIMYEMLTFQLPYEEVADDGVVKCRHMLNPNWRPDLSQERSKAQMQGGIHLEAYKRLMTDCWAEDPANRPGFYKVAERLMALIRWTLIINDLRQKIKGTRGLKDRTRGGALPSQADDDVVLSSRSTADAPEAVATAAAGRSAGVLHIHALPDAAASPRDAALVRPLLDGTPRKTLVEVPAVVRAVRAPPVETQEPIAAPSSSPVTGVAVINPTGVAQPKASSFTLDLEPQLESAPTLASSGSRPLSVPAASIQHRSSEAPPLSRPLQSLHPLPSMPERTVLPKPQSAAPQRVLPVAPTGGAQPPTAPRAMGASPDGFGMLSPFNVIRSLSDDDEEDATPVVPVRSSIRPPAAIMASAGAVCLPTPPEVARPPARSPGDPFSMASPFNSINSLDSSDDDEAPVGAVLPPKKPVARHSGAAAMAATTPPSGVPNGMQQAGLASGLPAAAFADPWSSVGSQITRSESVGLPPPPFATAAAAAAVMAASQPDAAAVTALRAVPQSTAVVPDVLPPLASAASVAELAAAMSATPLAPVASIARLGVGPPPPLGARVPSLGPVARDPFAMHSPFNSVAMEDDEE